MMASKDSCKQDKEPFDKCEQQTECSVFDPPLYIQRYLKVVKFIKEKNDNIKKVVDFGCNNLSLFRYLKNLVDVREIVFMDIDEQVLKDNLWKVATLPYDHLNKREYPLNVHVLSGDATITNYNLLDVDFLAMIEVIEHLYEDVLPALVKNVFGIIQPKYVFVSTPNAEYNKYFESLNSGKFRHPDHKFEWDSFRFEKWANLIAEDHCYDVTFDGCGLDEEGLFCTQIAIFTRKSFIEKFFKNVENNVKVLHIENYPFNQETLEEKLKNKVLVSFQSLFSSLLEETKICEMQSKHSFYKLKDCNKGDLSLLKKDNDNSSPDYRNDEHFLSFTLVSISDVNCDSFEMADKTFYYVISEESVLFLVNTFCIWLEDIRNFEYLRSLLSPTVLFEEINGQHCMKLYMYDTDQSSY